MFVKVSINLTLVQVLRARANPSPLGGLLYKISLMIHFVIIFQRVNGAKCFHQQFFRPKFSIQGTCRNSCASSEYCVLDVYFQFEPRFEEISEGSSEMAKEELWQRYVEASKHSAPRYTSSPERRKSRSNF